MKKNKTRVRPLDNSRLKTSSILKSRRKVNIKVFAQPISEEAKFSEFWEHCLPKILAGQNLRILAEKIVQAHLSKKMVILGMGAHPIKVGLSALIIELMKRGIVNAIAGNGALAIHDFEIALAGQTSEEVEKGLEDGSFGVSKETAQAFKKVSETCAKQEIGFGEALGKLILSENLPYQRLSLFANAVQLGIPATVHIAIGTDIVHIHPGLNGAGLGRGSLYDFRIFARSVSGLEKGVYINFGSAVIMPEVFLKALSLARNLGYRIEDFTTANLDFITHYRPRVNVLERPTRKAGSAINIIGHHELVFPLLFGGILNRLKGGK